MSFTWAVTIGVDGVIFLTVDKVVKVFTEGVLVSQVVTLVGEVSKTVGRLRYWKSHWLLPGTNAGVDCRVLHRGDGDDTAGNCCCWED